MATIEFKNLCKQYDDGFQAVRDVNLNVLDGEFIVLVGPSGCGKSTTLRMLAGLEEISSGEILLGGRRINDLEPGDRDIAMVFQNYALYPHMSVRQNLSFGLRMRGMPKTEIERRVAEVAEILSMESMLDRKPRQLSGGQRQRVAVGRAIVRQPQAFLFDEPLSNLDAKLRAKMRTELAKLHQRLQTTTVYVTHDQVEAMTLGDRIVVMNEGRIQQVGPPLELYHRPANRFVAQFIGSPSMNLLSGRVNHGAFQCGPIQYPLGPAAPSLTGDAPTLFGARPEALSMDAVGPLLAEVTLDVVEPMGSETLVYFDLVGEPWVASLHITRALRPGDRIPLHLATSDWHLFRDDDAAERIAGGAD